MDRKDKIESRLAEALLVSEEQYLKNYDEIDTLTKTIRFKLNRLNPGKQLLTNSVWIDLLSYLRAHCLVLYDGPYLQHIKMTEASVLEFEILVLD